MLLDLTLALVDCLKDSLLNESKLHSHLIIFGILKFSEYQKCSSALNHTGLIMVQNESKKRRNVFRVDLDTLDVLLDLFDQLIVRNVEFLKGFGQLY